MTVKLVFSLLVLGLVGCGAAPVSNDPRGAGGAEPQAANPNSDAPVPDASESNATTPPVASLQLSNGNRIDFYDGGKEGILVTELGEAYTPPALKDIDVNALGAVNTWNTLSPSAPPPQALLDLQARTDAYAQAAGNAPAVDRPIAERSTGGSSPEASTVTTVQGVSAIQEGLDGCNNGCCDAGWLYNNVCRLGDSGGGDWNWFYFNKGSSWVQNDSINSIFEAACAAVGTSRFGIHRGDYIHTFSIPEGHYQNYFWHAACQTFLCSNSDNHSVVNASSNNQPLAPTNIHTFCGEIFH